MNQFCLKIQTNIAYMQHFRLEKGKINPSILYLLEIANGLEIPVSKLLEEF
jgi:hypothetical protein